MTETRPDPSARPPAAPRGLFAELFHRSRAFLLLAAMFLQILLTPIGYPDSLLPVIMRIAIIFAAVIMAADSRRHLVIGLALGIPGAVLTLATIESNGKPLDFAAYFMILALYLYVIKLMLEKIFRARYVTVDSIAMALCTYLLLGQVWMLFYAPIAYFDPDAFTQPLIQGGRDGGLTLTYFSYVTLTTLGYGDISPVSNWARALAILEALTGTLFLAVLISRLVGTYRSSEYRQRMKELRGDD
jgi:hypothetical protein